MIVTIDGPTASGKSTVAKLLAQRLGWYYLNTGLLYRALAYLLIKELHYNDDQLSDPLATDLAHCLRMIRYTYDDHDHHGASIVVNNVTITDRLKTSAMDRHASIVSSNSLVRSLLLAYQRELAQNHKIVVDGRDTGSVVFPTAEYKFFLTASSKLRARRWRADQALQGKQFSEKESKAIINERDTRDSTRKDAPLVVPVGGYVIDNSAMTVEETVDTILRYMRNH